MNEQTIQLLERLLDMIGEGGEAAFWLVVLLLGQGYFTPILWAGTIFVIMYLIYRTIMGLLPGWRLTNEVRRKAGVCDHGEVLRSEREAVLSLIDDGLKYREERKSTGRRSQ